MADLTLHRRAHAFNRRRAITGESDQFQSCSNRRQWIAEFVRKHGQEFVLATIGLAQGFFAFAQRFVCHALVVESVRVPTHSRTDPSGLRTGVPGRRRAAIAALDRATRDRARRTPFLSPPRVSTSPSAWLGRLDEYN